MPRPPRRGGCETANFSEECFTAPTPLTPDLRDLLTILNSRGVGREPGVCAPESISCRHVSRKNVPAIDGARDAAIKKPVRDGVPNRSSIDMAAGAVQNSETVSPPLRVPNAPQTP